MTNQQLAETCRDILAEADKHESWCVEMAKALLPCLEAEPTEYRDIWDARVSKDVALELAAEGYTLRKLYDAPPVPELKPIELPRPHREDYVGAKVMYADDVEAAIRDAGYEVKS